MIVERGAPWGEHGAAPPGTVVVRSDAEARGVVEDARRAGRQVPTLALLGGDLCRTLGGTGDEARLHSAHALRVPVDLGAVLLDGRLHWFVAHLVVRRSWLFGRVVLAMNAEHLGDWDVAPSSHPNDGRIDVLDVTMSPRARLQARRRLRQGTHLPHPRIRVERAAAVQLELDRPTPVWLDGDHVGKARSLSIRVEADALTCVV